MPNTERRRVRRRRAVIDECWLQLVVGRPHRSAEVLGLRRRHRRRTDAVGHHRPLGTGRSTDRPHHDVVGRCSASAPAGRSTSTSRSYGDRAPSRLGPAKLASASSEAIQIIRRLRIDEPAATFDGRARVHASPTATRLTQAGPDTARRRPGRGTGESADAAITARSRPPYQWNTESTTSASAQRHVREPGRRSSTASPRDRDRDARCTRRCRRCCSSSIDDARRQAARPGHRSPSVAGRRAERDRRH